jgi:hypothetical protein
MPPAPHSDPISALKKQLEDEEGERRLRLPQMLDRAICYSREACRAELRREPSDDEFYGRWATLFKEVGKQLYAANLFHRIEEFRAGECSFEQKLAGAWLLCACNPIRPLATMRSMLQQYERHHRQIRICLLTFAKEVVSLGGRPGPTEAGRTGQREESGKSGEKTKLRSWTQEDLDAAIREYKAHRAGSYKDLVEGVRQGRAGATKSARKLFGRNAIARALGVRAKAMVTKSEAWQEIARELKLSRVPAGHRRLNKSKRVGSDIGLEQQAREQDDPTAEAAMRREAIALARENLPVRVAEPIIERLERGDITVQAAYELIGLTAAQAKDDKTRKILPSP